MTVGTLGVPAAAIVKKRMENGREGKNRKRGRVERGTGSKEEKRRAGGKETSLKGILNLTEGGIYPISRSNFCGLLKESVSRPD